MYFDRALFRLTEIHTTVQLNTKSSSYCTQ